jgi:A/G-specific adenine glycosylase
MTVKPLLAWYDANARVLPWRAPPGTAAMDPYKVWLSEIMLQQTTVSAVKPYFARFTALWPTVTALAHAPLDDVLKEWAGLGYYARARNLHACAQTIARDHGGQFPDSVDGLRALPGIGAYTAAAIAAIAFGRPAAVVDGNIERVMSRLYRIATPLPAAKAQISAQVAALTPADRPGDFAQAMMDLGATICTPKSPDCPACPWRTSCGAAAAGDMLRYPVKPPKRAQPTRRALAFWLEVGGHVFLRRRPPKGLLGGLLEIPSSDWTTAYDSSTALAAVPVAADWQMLPDEARHTFTHFHLELGVLRARLAERPALDGAIWHPLHAIDDAGLPTVMMKVVEAVRRADGRLL